MQSTLCVVLLATAAAIVAAQTPAPPVIPMQWQAGHVSVFWNVNMSAPTIVGGQQYWDYTQDAIRQDFSFSGASLVNFNQYATQTQYQIQIGTWANNVPACVKNPEMDKMADRFLFSNGTYNGKQMNGQTLCDVWWVIQVQPTGPATNVTIWWDSAHGAPVAWTTSAVDGSSFTEVSLFNYQPNVGVPGTGLFAIPTPLCSTVAAASPKAPVIPKLHW